MRHEKFPVAVGADPVLLELSQPIPELTGEYAQGYRRWYAMHAEGFVDALYAGAPGGLVDAIFAEMAKRAAGILRVAK